MKKIIIICGPTAVGKTTLSLQIARRFNAELISADSGQIWKGLDVGTAKAREFHLVDAVSPEEHFDAACFVSLADKAIDEICSRGSVPFVVGGTGMYLKMLVSGMCQAPPRDKVFREKCSAEIKMHGLSALYDRLEKIDPVGSKSISKNDKTRIIRALEVFSAVGISSAELFSKHKFADKRYSALKIGLELPRKELYERIGDRVDAMLKKGWLDEVKVLLSKYDVSCQAFSAIGYRELSRHLNGEMGFDEAIDLIKRNSRRYAKRQLTWFKADSEIKWFNPIEVSEIEKEIFLFLKEV